MTNSASTLAGDPLAMQLQTLLDQPSPSPEASLALARQLYQAGRFANAERLTARAVAVHSDNREIGRAHV